MVDGLKSTRPIEYTVRLPEEAAGMFDIVTYQKGAAVLRMLEQYLGAEEFRDGVRLYLRAHEYDNADTTDLWDAIEDSSDQLVRALMDSWVFQPGYPLITVRTEQHHLILAQSIFRYLPDELEGERQWHVPIFVKAKTSAGINTQTELMTGNELRITLPSQPEWAVVNAGGHGFYRVTYSPELLSRLTANLEENLSAVERFNLLNDMWAVALAGLTPMATYLDFVRLFRDESNRNVWTAILGAFTYLYRLLEPQQRSGLQAFIRTVLQPISRHLGWHPRDEEDELVSQMRGDLLRVLGTLGDDTATQLEAKALYQRYKANWAEVDRNVVPAIIYILAYTGGDAEYEEFVAKFKAANTPQEEERYLFALAAFRRSDLVEQTLTITINGEVRTQDAPYLMRSLLLNTNARERAWAFMKEHWEQMVREYPDDSIVHMCEGITGLVTAELEADVRDFFASHPVKQSKKTMEQHFEKLRIAVACKQREESQVEAYFAHHL